MRDNKSPEEKTDGAVGEAGEKAHFSPREVQRTNPEGCEMVDILW
jgi:hypothetical protein